MQDVVDLHEDRENIARTKKATLSVKTDIRKRAMETLKSKYMCIDLFSSPDLALVNIHKLYVPVVTFGRIANNIANKECPQNFQNAVCGPRVCSIDFHIQISNVMFAADIFIIKDENIQFLGDIQLCFVWPK